MSKWVNTFPYTDENGVSKTAVFKYSNISVPFFKACQMCDFEQSHIEETARYSVKLSKPKEDH
jgi:hypothetical protein